MCSPDVCLCVWFVIFIKFISTCKGVLLRRRMMSVSVVIFKGIRFSTINRRGRISCVAARRESITKICSCFKSSTAGKFFCTFNGMMC
ncbi:hypothetical protein Barb7_01567 [Bacteroidales bacterium Barb7]|nr:hypothetical protein Barb4_05290 [Bacteroidales bacterium Barb4]OAV74876.1 hypothetical protein Barb7_01567 [Bacteroidales bacterium Barb7]